MVQASAARGSPGALRADGHPLRPEKGWVGGEAKWLVLLFLFGGVCFFVSFFWGTPQSDGDGVAFGFPP